jgi:hypothetical protein
MTDADGRLGLLLVEWYRKGERKKSVILIMTRQSMAAREKVNMGIIRRSMISKKSGGGKWKEKNRPSH